MKIFDLENLDLDILVNLLRDYGITSYSNGKCNITIGPRMPQNVEPSRFEDELPQEKASCGHSLWEANEVGECLHGCLPQQEDKK